MTGEAEEENGVRGGSRDSACVDGAVCPVPEQQHIKLSLVICVSSSGRCQRFLSQ